jgi:hypothetical protein
MILGSADLSDDEFLKLFLTCKLSPEKFRHADHLRLAWLQTRREALGDAVSCVRNDIRRFAVHNGVEHLYHETITIAWVRLVATHQESFEAFLSDNRARLNLNLLHHFWTPSLLASNEARTRWVPPDLLELPSS